MSLMNSESRLISVRRPVLVVVYGFPEADPDVENSQSAAQAAEKSAGDCGPQVGETLEKIVVGPFRPPGQQDQQDTGSCADKDEGQNRDAVQPQVSAVAKLRFVVYRSLGFEWRRRGRRQGCLRVGTHAAHVPAVKRRAIRTFYDLRAFMRSATSR